MNKEIKKITQEDRQFDLEIEIEVAGYKLSGLVPKTYNDNRKVSFNDAGDCESSNIKEDVFMQRTCIIKNINKNYKIHSIVRIGER